LNFAFPQKLLFLFLILISFTIQTQSQNPLVKVWDFRFGGTKDELLESIQITRDGGFILAGFSNSDISGDKTQGRYDTIGLLTHDYWIIKLDSSGNKEWDKRYGGDQHDELYEIRQTKDGGYILGGNSQSGISGDKSDDTKGSNGHWDYWIIKIDSLGNKKWDKDFGGTGYERFYSVIEISDGGYLIGGWTDSDTSIDKTQASKGINDYWILKIDSAGNKIWDKSFGGTGDDRLYSMLEIPTGGFLLGGYSSSDSSGDKTQNAWPDTTFYHDSLSGTDTIYIEPSADYWIVKIDASGNKLWDKRFGGLKADYFDTFLMTPEGDFVLAGSSVSQAGGDKTQQNWLPYGSNFWIVKIDSSGNKIWDKRYGYSGEGSIGSIIQTLDTNYLIAGRSWTQMAAGDKSEDNLGYVQTWILKTDTSGNVTWDKTIFSPGYDNTFPDYGFALQTSSACYVTANFTPSEIGGYKSQDNWDTAYNSGDYWMVKLCDSLWLNSDNVIYLIRNSLSVFPNPVSEKITIRLRSDVINAIEIYNSLGSTVYSSAVICESCTVPCASFNPGIYFVKLTSDNSILFEKFIKE
jgi:hypothetical protein